MPHRFVTSAHYELPFGKARHFLAARHPVENGVLGGWSVRSIVTKTSTVPFRATVQGNPANTGTYGMVLRGRPLSNWDFSASKSLQLLEQLRLQFRFEASTFSNTPRFGAPGNVLGTATFGVMTGAGTPRNLQFGMKLIW